MMKKAILAACLLLISLPSMAASCFITEFSQLGTDGTGNRLTVSGSEVAEQVVTYTTATSSSAFNVATRYIRIVCDAKAHFEIGASPTATANDTYLPADTPEYIGVDPGQVISVYDGTS